MKTGERAGEAGRIVALLGVELLVGETRLKKLNHEFI
jgi:hypothetical protein